MMSHNSMKEFYLECKMVSPQNQFGVGNSRKLRLSTYSQGYHEIDVSHKQCERNAISEVEDVDIEMQFCFSEGLSDENDCMSLSSSNMPVSHQSSDSLQSLVVLEIDSCDVLLYYQFSAMSTMLRGNWTFFNVYQRSSTSSEYYANPLEAFPILERTQDGVGKGPTECNMSHNSLGDNGMNYSSMYSETLESGYKWSLCEDSSILNSSSSPFGTHDKPSCFHDHALDTRNVSLPLLDLEGEESKWYDDAFDLLDQDFPSPSYHTQCNLQTRSSRLSDRQTSNQLLDGGAVLGSTNSIFGQSPKHELDVKSLPKDSEVDEPLFWPYDQKSYWSPELEGNYLAISPRALLDIRRPIGCHATKSVQFRLHQRNDFSLHRKSIQQRCKGRIPSSSLSPKSISSDHKTRGLNSQVSHGIATTSSLSRSTRLSSEKASCGLSKKQGVEGHHRSNSIRNKHDINKKTSSCQYLLEFEADDFRSYMAGGVPIEALVGLDEFDGHEGIGRMMSGMNMEEFDEGSLLQEVLIC
uniref:Phenylalanine--tRNA ligase alpha subunit n=1 Tax=Anthurium amnicola TaxID=1678845 RepID=A0A1D1YG61_9ARAE